MSDRTFARIVAPEPYHLTRQERAKAATMAYQGVPILRCDHSALVSLVLQQQDALQSMTAHMRAHMMECPVGRLPEPNQVTVES